MKETGIPRRGTIPAAWLPADADLHAEMGSYKAYLSRSEEPVLIHTAEYHSGVLHISRADLARLLVEIDERTG